VSSLEPMRSSPGSKPPAAKPLAAREYLNLPSARSACRVRTVIAQARRGSPVQAPVGRLISAGRAGGSPVIIGELTAGRSRQIAVTIRATSRPDMIDVHVALAAAERGHAVQSDDGDLARVNPELISSPSDPARRVPAF